MQREAGSAGKSTSMSMHERTLKVFCDILVTYVGSSTTVGCNSRTGKSWPLPDSTVRVVWPELVYSSSRSAL